ncbi:Bifunctional purine biosynthetic protein ADE1 [Lecanora helva]
MKDLRILLIGSGGRENALAWRLNVSRCVSEIHVAPGNPGTARGLDKVSNIPIPVNDFAGLVDFAKRKDVNLVIPGPEVPLVQGISDYFKQCIPNIRVFGPSLAAAKLEGSKTFAKDFMSKYGIPTARYRNFSNYEEARRYLDQVDYDVVIKATGLAAGKGVILPSSKREAQDGLKGIMVDKDFQDAGDEVVIEEFVRGDEISILSFVDGHTIRSLPAAQDHKQAYDGDCGPNTGGMGAYAPAPVVTRDIFEEIHKRILQPTIDAMRRSEGYPFVGLLFTGLMITTDGPKVLEYNVRFGDPETQTLLPLLSAETDLAEILVACTEGRLDGTHLHTKPRTSSATVVAAAAGYPASYRKGDTITIDNSNSLAETDHIFHAGTSLGEEDRLKTAGGRVIAATATAESLEAALRRAYWIMESINWPGKHYRKDIGYRAIKAAATSPRAPLAPDSSITYADAGVSITSGNELVSRIKFHVKSTARPGAHSDIGGFGGIFSLADAGYLKPPVLVISTDGVGTKLAVAQGVGQHDSIGVDLVAMNVNDLVVQGAEPLYMTDVFTCSKLDLRVAEDVIRGICAGCREARCALVGGETAEMAGFFEEGKYDVAGACAGAIESGRKVLPLTVEMRNGDVLLGLASSGCHSNGFSLVRKILERAVLRYSDIAPWDRVKTVGQSLLTPTRIYVKSLLRLIEENLVKGMAHITGGGLLENIPRMLPAGLAAEMDAQTWECPEVLRWLKRAGHIDDHEFARTFNTGLGMVLVVAPDVVGEATRLLEESGERVYHVGKLGSRGEEGCVVKNLETWNA